MKRYFSLILAIAATVSAQIVPSTGNVRGPTSATDNAVARYDGTTGKLIQNSGVTIDDSGNLTVSGTGTSSVAGSLGIGTTSPNKSTFSTAVTVNGGTNSGFEVAVGDTRIAGLYAASTVAVLNAFANVPLAFSTNNTTQMQLFANGNLFVGASPVDGGQKLQVAGDLALSGAGAGFTINATSGNSLNVIQRSVNTAVGAIQFKTSSTADWIIGVRETSDSDFHLFSYGTVADALTIARSTGNATFAGNLKLSAYGAGTLTTDSSGNVTATSDERAKNITGMFTKGLAEVVKLTPKTYTWKPETGLNTTDEVASLTAQDLIAAGIPEAVSTYRTVADVDEDGKQKVDADGRPVTKRIDATYTVSDRTVIAALVNAVKELKAEVDALKAARN